MAKSPVKRRGISLDPRADTAGPLTELTSRTSESDSPELGELLDALRQLGSDQDARWQRQEERLQQQLHQLQHQQEQIARQSRQLQALEKARREAGRRGALLAVLALVSVAALGYHAWPRVQGVAGELARARTDLNRVAPELQAVRQQLASDLGHVSGTMTSVRQDVSGVRSDLASLRKTVDGLPARGDGEQADSATQLLPRDASATADPYRGMRPRMPW